MPVPGSKLCRQEKSYRLFGEKGFASAVLMVDMLEGCTEKHSKLLHQSFMRPVKENFGEQQAAPNPGASSHYVESHTHACSSPRQGQTKLALPIVPVKVRAKGQTAYHHTYALLDSGSTKTFCSESLVEKLDVKGEPANLTTVNSSESADVELVALEVVAAKGGAERPSVIQLPKVYALPWRTVLPRIVTSVSGLISKISDYPKLIN